MKLFKRTKRITRIRVLFLIMSINLIGCYGSNPSENLFRVPLIVTKGELKDEIIIASSKKSGRYGCGTTGWGAFFFFNKEKAYLGDRYNCMYKETVKKLGLRIASLGELKKGLTNYRNYLDNIMWTPLEKGPNYFSYAGSTGCTFKRKEKIPVKKLTVKNGVLDVHVEHISCFRFKHEVGNNYPGIITKDIKQAYLYIEDVDTSRFDYRGRIIIVAPPCSKYTSTETEQFIIKKEEESSSVLLGLVYNQSRNNTEYTYDKSVNEEPLTLCTI